MIVLKTGLTPSASGSAYLELENPSVPSTGIKSLKETKSGVKLSCTVHGPRPLPRSAPFTPHVLLSTNIKYAPFATRQRLGYVRDANERDLAVHLENALRGVIIGERWPKSGLDINIIVLEGEGDSVWADDASATEVKNRTGGWGSMSILSSCITIASAALADAGIDCIDFVCGGMAAVVLRPALKNSNHQQSSIPPETSSNAKVELVLDPCPSEDQELVAACVVGYLQSRDEVTEIWVKGNKLNSIAEQSQDIDGIELLLDRAIEAAMATRLVLIDAITESTELKLRILDMHTR